MSRGIHKLYYKTYVDWEAEKETEFTVSGEGKNLKNRVLSFFLGLRVRGDTKN